MNKVTFNLIPGSIKYIAHKFLPLMIRAILLLAICFSAAAPVSLVSSKSPTDEYQFPHQVVVDVCLSPVITTDTTWIAGNTYQANCIITINAGVTLTIQGGAVVQFGSASSGMRVLGTLIAEGSSGTPVVFTSAGDNSANSWYGIVLYENSAASFDYASIRYGGSGICTGGYEDSTYNSCYSRAQLDIRKANLQMVHSEIRDGHTDGICLDSPGKTPYIQETAITNNTNGVSSDNIGWAINQTTINMQPDYLNLVFSGNDFNKVGIKVAQLNQDVSLGGSPLRFYCGFTSCPIEVPSGRTLTVQAGASLDMTSVNSTLSVLTGGTLLILGTESHPVTIDEAGIEVAYGGMAEISYSDLDGGDRVYYGLYDRADGVTVNNSTFHDFYDYGVYAYAESGKTLRLNMTDVDVTDNLDDGIYIGMGSSATFDFSLEGGTISGSGDNGITVAGGPTKLTLKDVVISGNGITGFDGSERNGIYATSNNVSLTLENVQFNNNVNESLYWNCNGSVTAKNLTASGNARNALALAGCTISTGRQWDLAEAGIPTIVSGTILVNSGGIITISPGSRLGFENNTKLKVDVGGALYALGTTDKPIVFSRAYETQTSDTAWRGLENYRGTMILRHCEVSYSNYRSSYGGRGVGIGLDGSAGSPTYTIIQNCKIHDNEIGISKNANIQATTSIVYNEIYSNPTFGIDWIGYDAVNAFYNYWGSPTGPTHPSNPGGTGDIVDNNVNFIPFLTAPPEEQTLIGEMWVSSAGPNLISPGEVNDYAIQYLNLTADPIYGAVAVIQLPLAGKYLSSTEGGTYWPARHQVFWLLGDIEPGTQGMLTARVRFDWGLPGSYRDGSYTVLAGTNYQSDQLALAEYTGYAPDNISNLLPMDQAAFNALLLSNPALNTLYNNAIGEGFAFIEASQTNFDDGSVVSTGYMRTPDKRLARMLNLSVGEALAITTNGSTFFKIEDLTSGQLTNLLTLERYTWGDWAETEGVGTIQVDCNYARCMRNCSLKTISIEMMKNTAEGAAVWMLGLPTLVPVLGWGLFGYELLSLTHDVYVCHVGCNANPLTGCCNAGDVLWAPSSFGGNSMCERYDCTSSNSFPPIPNRTQGCGTGFRCVAGNGSQGGCKPCTEGTLAMSVPFGPQFAISVGCSRDGINAGLPRCSDLGIRVAKDPNALYGPVGDVLPTDTMNYRITYENEGEGDAYGVYILNQLPEQLDENTLVINNGGVYMPAERQIFWYVGELGPKGDPTSKGEVTYSAQLKAGLTDGSAVLNQAVVYFPSVPEETPTNTWNNLVYSLVATPQSLETDYMTPIEIILAGRPEGSLNFELVSSPMGGELSGTAPDLTYTPLENFSGIDFFTFTVSVGEETSQPTQVTINVLTTGDTTSPTVLWVEPANEEVDVSANGEPIYVIPEGDVYSPVLVAKFSEQVQETTITGASVFVTGPKGVLPSKAALEPVTNQLTIQVLSRFDSFTTYTATLSSAITDMQGNPLAADYTWEFTTGQVKLTGSSTYLPLLLR